MSETIAMQRNLEFKIPQTPNFIQVKIGNEFVALSIAELSDAELSSLADSWKKKLLEEAATRRTREVQG